jgi:nicotinamidase-related amidase
MVRVGWSADFAEALKQPVDAQAGAMLPENWWTYPLALEKQESDIEVTKRQWGAFTAPTGAAASPSRYRYDYPVRYLNQYRRRIDGAQRLGAGLRLILVEDACSAATAEQHQGSMTHIFPRIARVRSTGRYLPRYDLCWASQWAHPKWVRTGITSLEEYARHF